MMPRRIITLLSIALMCWCGAMAQAHYVSKVSLGAKGGVTLSKMSFSPGVKQKLVQGNTFGVTMKYWEERNFGFIAEINYEQRGWSENFEDAPFNFERRLDYIQIPILTSVFFGNRHTKCFFNAGPEIGVLIGTSYKANFDVHDIANIPDFPGNRMTAQMSMEPENKIDYGISGGVGCEFALKRRNIINLEARYYFGIGNIFHDARTDIFSASRGMSIMITLGYSYRIR